MVNKTTKFKKQGKPKKDLKKVARKLPHPEKPKGGPKPDTDCYYCNGKGHWKRNCSKYLADRKSGLVKKKKVSWCRLKRCTVAKSSTESEYIALRASSAVWMKRFNVELGVVPSALDPLVIYCDNMGAIANAQEPRSHKKLKHIKLRFHSIREYIEDGEMVREALAKDISEGPHEDHAADVGSQQQRSNMASTEALAGANAPLVPAGANAPMIDGAPEPRYPVDDVQDMMKEFELHQPMRNISCKVAIGTALPCKPGALHHDNCIAAGYARVTVDDVLEGYEDLEIDYATPEGDLRLGDVKHQIILWQKK
ncbi:hypothetical protein QYE76_016218 [Lolium multiflorum]|uniref:CCHC-type domain-containing protein n=1 Tax=Lolium multiflorum TaxID=4521 RepID=A0AAD8U5V9_LOLMU|nr:hypothetical protein QYE76_016218 [Lolium multiflorum]